jgi:hypothetical protein
MAGSFSRATPRTSSRPSVPKDLYLAVCDAIILACALAHWHATGSKSLLDSYSDTCLRRVWRAEHFSCFMTTTLHADPESAPFDQRLQLSRLHRIAEPRTASAEPAENYTGLPIGWPQVRQPVSRWAGQSRSSGSQTHVPYVRVTAMRMTSRCSSTMAARNASQSGCSPAIAR